MNIPQRLAATTAPVDVPPDRNCRHAVGLLVVVSVMNYLERQICTMNGIAFAPFQSAFGISIARLADRSHRPGVVGADCRHPRPSAGHRDLLARAHIHRCGHHQLTARPFADRSARMLGRTLSKEAA